MNAETLASLPIFTFSLAFCALVGAYAVSVLIRWMVKQASLSASSAAASPKELETIDYTERSSRQINAFMRHMRDLELLAGDLPQILNDSSWEQLLDFQEQLDLANEQLRKFIDSDDVDRAYPLAKFLCAAQVRPSPINGLDPRLALPSLFSWQYNSLKLIQRLATKFQDAAAHYNSSAAASLPADFEATLQSLRKRIIQDERRYREPTER